MYKKALKIKPDFAEVYNNMGNAIIQSGNMSKAIKVFEKAIKIDPNYPEVHRHLTTVKKYTRKDPHFLQVKSLYKNMDMGEEARCQLSFALAKMYEDIGELDKAFEFLSTGNDLRKKILGYEIDIDKKFYEKLRKTEPLLRENSLEIQSTSSSITPIFILGMPRSGTTLVEQIVSSHSQVIGAGELTYIFRFSEGLFSNTSSISKRNIADFRQKYLSSLAKRANGENFIVDKMPQNFQFIPLICAALPEAKIVHIQRDAAATCWSNYKQYFSAKDGLGYCYNLNDVVSYYKLYVNLMKLWQSKYGEQIYNLNYEKLTNNQVSETKSLIKFLGLAWEDSCLCPEKNIRSVRTASQQQVRKKVYRGSSESWKKYEPYLDNKFKQLSSL